LKEQANAKRNVEITAWAFRGSQLMRGYFEPEIEVAKTALRCAQ
jgi:hypothetical protein